MAQEERHELLGKIVFSAESFDRRTNAIYFCTRINLDVRDRGRRVFVFEVESELTDFPIL